MKHVVKAFVCVLLLGWAINSCSLDMDALNNTEGDSSGVGSSGNLSSGSEASGNSSSSGSGASSNGSSSGGHSSGASSSSGQTEQSSSSVSGNPSSSSAGTTPPISSSSANIIHGGDLIDNRDGKRYKTVVIGNQVWMAENLNYGGPSDNIGVCYGTDGLEKRGDGDNKYDYWFTPEDIAGYCAEYGRLYDWRTIMAGAANSDRVPSGVRGICPDGWHIPSDKEWEALALYAGDEYCIFAGCDPNNPDLTGMYAGTRLKAKSGWRANDYYGDGTDVEDGNGTDNFGFAALAGGFCFDCAEKQNLLMGVGYYRGIGEYGYWWTATHYHNVHTGDTTEAFRRRMKFNENTVSREFQKKTGYLSSVRCVKD